MREPADVHRIRRLLAELGLRSKGPGRIYLTGGATALLEGWRESTADVDLKLDPEPPGIFEAIAVLKNELGINIELASPDAFIPSVPGWKERSLFVGRFGEVEVFHFDPTSQCLAKIERGHTRDLFDVRSMLERKLTTPDLLRSSFEVIRPRLIRYPAIDADVFAAKIDDVLRGEG